MLSRNAPKEAPTVSRASASSGPRAEESPIGTGGRAWESRPLLIPTLLGLIFGSVVIASVSTSGSLQVWGWSSPVTWLLLAGMSAVATVGVWAVRRASSGRQSGGADADPTRGLRWAYVAGLLLITAIVGVRQLTIAARLDESMDAAVHTNRAGWQRTLSERMARLATVVMLPEASQAAVLRLDGGGATGAGLADRIDRLAGEWTGAANELREVLASELSGRGVRSTAGREAMARSEVSREAVLDAARELSEALRAGEAGRARRAADVVVATVPGFLNDMDTVVRALAEQKRSELQRTSVVTWVTAAGVLMTLAVVVAGIMEPAVRHATRASRALRTQAEEVKTLAMVVRRTANAAVITDVNRKIVWVNEGFTRITGYSAEEAVGKSPGKLLQCDRTDPATVEKIRESLARGGSFRGQLLNRRKDGTDFWLDLDIQPMVADDGSLQGFMAIEADVTERESLRRRLSCLFDALAEGVVLRDRDGTIIECNPAAERILAMTRDEILGRKSAASKWSTVREDGTALPLEDHPFHRTLTTGAPTRGAVMGLRLPDGSTRWVSVNTASVLDVAGRVEAVVTSFADITEQKLEAQRLDLAIRGGALGTWDWDLRTNAVKYNDQWAAMLGRDPGEVEPNISAWERLAHPEDVTVCHAALRAHCQGETPEYRCEHRMLRGDGSWAWVLDVGQVTERDAEGAPKRMCGVQLDITASKQIALSLAAARDAAEQAARAKSDFLANMSHEIRTPLTAVLGFTDLMLEDAEEAASGGGAILSDAERLEHLRTVRRNGSHLLTVINDILDMAKIEAGKMRLEMLSVDPSEVLREVAELVRPGAEDKGLRVRVAFDTAVPARLTTDPTRLRQVLLNLAGNAVKFTEAGSVTLRMSAGPYGDGGELSVAVEDTGVGIAPEALGRLFEAFEQADTSTTRRFGGTGLGLSISSRLARMLGGRITVESSPGRGSTFTLKLMLSRGVVSARCA